VSVETVVVPQVKGRVRPEWTSWTESVDDDCPYVFALRVFYSKSVVAAGAPSQSRRASNSSTGASTPRLQFIGNINVNNCHCTEINSSRLYNNKRNCVIIYYYYYTVSLIIVQTV